MTNPMEEKEYLTLAEVAEYVGVKRASLYYYLHALEIKTLKFRLDKRAYLSLADAKRIKEIKEKPWLAGPEKEKPGAESKDAA